MKNNQIAICLTVLLLIITACKKDNGFGSDLLPGENALDLIFHEDTEITTLSKFEDPLRTDRILFNYLGYIEDPVFGKTTASSTVQFGLPVDFDLSQAPFTVKSVTMYLFYDNHYGDTTLPVSITVHKLNSVMNSSVIYKSDYIPSYNSTPIGQVTNFLIQPNTPVLLRDTDTITAKGIIKFPIDMSFGEEVNTLLQTGLITNDTLFNSRFPGFYIQMNPSQKGKAMMQLDLTHLSAGVYIELVDKEGKDQMFVLPFSNSTFTHTTLLQDYQGTRVEAAVQNGENISDGKLYIQSQAGVKTEIRFNNLEQYKGKLINKAVLEIYQVEKPSSDFLRVLNVYPLLKGSNGENVALSDYTSSFYGPALVDSSLTGINGEKLYRYQVNITNLMKDYAFGKKTFNSIYLTNYPVFDETPRFVLDGNSVLSQHVEPASLIFGTPDYIDAEKRMKLKVWYTLSK